MNDNDVEQAELLDSYWAEMRKDKSADVQAPSRLDSELAILARQLEVEMRPPEPDVAFSAKLKKLLADEGQKATTDNRRPTVTSQPAFRIRLVAGVAAAAAMLVVAMLGAALLMEQPQAVSAAEIVKKAQDAATNPTANNIKSLELVAVATWMINGSRTNMAQEHEWYKAPDRRRIETTSTQAGVSTQFVVVGNGQIIWSYDSQGDRVQITDGQISGLGQSGDGSVGASSLQDALKNASSCYDPKLVGEESVARRAAYKVALGPSKCPSASMPDSNGPMTLWLDKETFFVLKSVLRDAADTRDVQSSEVTSITYNPVIADSVFTFSAPAGANVVDNRATPVARAGSSQAQVETPTKPGQSTLSEIRQRVSYPVFVPAYVPNGLLSEPPLGGEQPQDKVEIHYKSQDGKEALLVLNGPQGCCLDAPGLSIPAGSDVALPGNIAAHYLPGVPESGGPILWWEQDGSYIALSGPNMTEDDLVRIAGSMSSQ